MGLYPIDCPACKKPLMWFSGNLPDQRCEQCKQGETVEAKEEVKTPKIVESSAIKNSSNISEVSYTDTNDLIVMFKNGGEYLYKSVPKEIYDNMIKSDSAGKYLTVAVKGKFEYEKLDKKKSAEMKTVKVLDAIQNNLGAIAEVVGYVKEEDKNEVQSND